ncbi:hypothetical protein ACJRO7_028332 [Eucalyptus globulus]|uniref:Uncharacterized protein n=1 Tax=Eucalyptus globulus TaxID=34317 RepID=A0ABD3K017_EUCGL
MVTLQKFKSFAAQCSVALSSTCSPGASSVIQLCRQSQQITTLQMLFTRGGGIGAWGKKKKKSVSGCTLKDLFVSPLPSPERDDDGSGGARGNGRGGEELFPFHAGSLGGLIAGPSSLRPVFVGLRFRSLMLRRLGVPRSRQYPSDMHMWIENFAVNRDRGCRFEWQINLFFPLIR